jgi:hypothetical protein
VPHSSVEAGERALPDPVERRGVPRCGPDVGTTPRTPCLIRVSPEAVGSCEGQRHNVTSRMPLTGTSGFVGGLGGRPPRSTRPQQIAGNPEESRGIQTLRHEARERRIIAKCETFH